MPALISAGGLAAARRSLEKTLVHTYTRTPMLRGAEGDDGHTPGVPGPVTLAVRCSYATSQRAVRDEGGVSTVRLPTLTVAATDPLRVGDAVSAVTDAFGGVLAAGPLRVERVTDDTAGLGASLLLVYELLGAEAT